MIDYLDFETTERVLRECVAERGSNFVYEKIYEAAPAPLMTQGVCRYVHNGCPSCLVGLFMSKLDVPLNLMKDWGGIKDVVDEGLVPFSMDQKSLEALCKAQDQQDSEFPWGAAVDAAVAVAARAPEGRYVPPDPEEPEDYDDE